MIVTMRLSPIVLLALVLVGCSGAGPRMYQVSGSASYAGTPIEEGTISFQSLEDKNAAPEGGVIKNGKFVVKVREGKSRVLITGSRPVTDPVVLKNAMGGAPPREDFIPAKHNRESMREVTITSNNSNLDFALEP